MEQQPNLPLLTSYVEHWARVLPEKPALVQHEDGRTLTYKQFSRLVDYFALALLDMGVCKGDRVATMLVLVPEHVCLIYACFKIGAIIAPLDVRLKEEEVVRDLVKINPKAFFFLGNTPLRDFRDVGKQVARDCPGVEHLIQFTPSPGPGDIMEGATGITDMMKKPKLLYLKLKDMVTGGLARAHARIKPRTGALIIYTTGTTGDPKPALLCHENILTQNEILRRGSDMDKDTRLLVNLPPSHAACLTEGVMTTIYGGTTAVLLRIFDVKLTLEAIEKRQVTVVGMIPTMFRMLWAYPDYDKYDLGSLKFAVFGGSTVDSPFISKLARMAPGLGTGLGMTECAGFATFTPNGIGPEEMAGQVGRAFPDLARVTVRLPMNKDRSAGDQVPDGEIGEICYHPPIVFSGYYNNPEETAKAITKEGILYTGDLGYFKDMGAYQALYMSGRRKHMIKQKGYNVFPGEVEDHIARLEGVDIAEVVGMSHRIIDEAIFAFVRPEKGADLTDAKVLAHCKDIASYKRPQHVEIWPPDKEFPLTRVAKVDKKELKVFAREIIEELRARGQWDAAGPTG